MINDIERLLDTFSSLEDDTTPERIKANRDKARGVIAVVRGQVLPISASADAVLKRREVLRLIGKWQRYFDEGYRSTESIDGLQEKIKVQLGELIESSQG